MARRRGLALFVVLLGTAVAIYGGWHLLRPSSAPDGGVRGGVESTAPPAAPITEGAPPEVKTQSVTIYQRAATDDVQLVGVPAQVVWFNAAADRARQIVQLVLEGVPGTTDAVPPAASGVRYRDVMIASSHVAWVDLDGASLSAVNGSDEEQALVAAIARSLTETLPDDVQRVGLLVDGQPRPTLAGHVDLTRTYTGREWPVTGPAPAPAAAAAPDAPATPAASGDATEAPRTSQPG